MEQEKDFLEREIQRLSFVLKALIEKIVKVSERDSQGSTLEEVDISLKKEFGFSLKSFGEFDKPNLIIKMREIPPSQIDELTGLLYLMLKNSNKSYFNTSESKIKSIDNTISLLHYKNHESSTFSLERTRLESNLRLLKNA